MKQYFNISAADGKAYFIFTSHIAYIEQGNRHGGCTIHVNTGGQHVEIVTKFSLAELLAMIDIK